MRKIQPRQLLSAIVKDCAIREVLQKVGISDFDMKINDDDEGIDNITECYLFVFGFFFTFAAGGDFLILWLLRKEKDTYMVQDHPKKIGCIIQEG